MACHPHDPGMPADKGFRGVHRVLGSVDGLKRFIEINASPYHGLNFCQGTVSEMLKDPNGELAMSFAISEAGKRFSTFIFAISMGAFSTFKRHFRIAAMWICWRR